MRVYSDPLQHAAIAAVVVAPLAARAGRSVLATAVAFFFSYSAIGGVSPFVPGIFPLSVLPGT